MMMIMHSFKSSVRLFNPDTNTKLIHPYISITMKTYLQLGGIDFK